MRLIFTLNPVRNPYTPGAGTPPPELAGREELIQQATIVLQRIQLGRPAKNLAMIGLRGVGKTVLLNRIHTEAQDTGLQTVFVESSEGRSLPALLAPQLREALVAMSGYVRARETARRGLRALAGFVGRVGVRYGDVEVHLDVEPEPGLADSGDLEHDLVALLRVAGEAARAGNTALCLFADELQYVEEDELAAIITALHRVAGQELPVAMIGAGLPQLRAHMGQARSYVERLFDFLEVSFLSPEAARRALVNPARAENVDVSNEAVQRIVETTECYPYFLQEWGKHAWDAAAASPIDIGDIERASEAAIAALDASFFRVRFDRLTASERRYLRAMAELGPGPHRSGDIAAAIGRTVGSLGPTRSRLIAKGMVWRPEHGATAFTVPLFDQFMRRVMPDDWRQ